MIDKLTKIPAIPEYDFPTGVVAVGHTKVTSMDLFVIFCDDVDERVVSMLRKKFAERGVRPGIIAMAEDADVALLSRDEQEQLYAYLGKLLGK